MPAALANYGSHVKIYHQGAFTVYVYNPRWVGNQKSGKFVNVYSIKIVNEGSTVQDFDIHGNHSMKTHKKISV